MKSYRQQPEQILNLDYSLYSKPTRLFLPFQISFLSSDFVLSLGEGWKHVSDRSEHTLLNFLTKRARRGKGNRRKKFTNKSPVHERKEIQCSVSSFGVNVKYFNCCRFIVLVPKSYSLGTQVLQALAITGEVGLSIFLAFASIPGIQIYKFCSALCNLRAHSQAHQAYS